MIQYLAEVRDEEDVVIYFKCFYEDDPIQNRRNAIAAMKEWIRNVKEYKGIFGKAVKRYATNAFHFRVSFILDNKLGVIESSQMKEEETDAYRAMEYIMYSTYGYDMGGEPYETFIEVQNDYLPVLADNKEEQFSLRDLLKL